MFGMTWWSSAKVPSLCECLAPRKAADSQLRNLLQEARCLHFVELSLILWPGADDGVAEHSRFREPEPSQLPHLRPASL